MGQGMTVSAAKFYDLFGSVTFDHNQGHPNQTKPVYVLLLRFRFDNLRVDKVTYELVYDPL